MNGIVFKISRYPISDPSRAPARETPLLPEGLCYACITRQLNWDCGNTEFLENVIRTSSISMWTPSGFAERVDLCPACNRKVDVLHRLSRVGVNTILLDVEEMLNLTKLIWKKILGAGVTLGPTETDHDKWVIPFLWERMNRKSILLNVNEVEVMANTQELGQRIWRDWRKASSFPKTPPPLHVLLNHEFSSTFAKASLTH